MIMGLSVSTFTEVHVGLSLLGIVTGLFVVGEMVLGRLSSIWTATFLATAALASATGFPIPPFGLDPPRILGVLSLMTLAAAGAALYVFELAGRWRSTYVVAAMTALYFDCFAGVTQTFSKVAFFNALAPTQTELPFVVAQVVLLSIFVGFAFPALKHFHPASSSSDHRDRPSRAHL